MAHASIRIGCAGWALRKDNAAAFAGHGSHLSRYARRFNAVEINSSFYRPHRRTTYERWAGSTPAAFRFSVKMPKSITHTARLAATEDQIDQFVDEIAGLGRKLGVVLMQLPPSMALDNRIAAEFFTALRQRFTGAVVCEPRHATWFEQGATTLLRRFDIGRVGADPAIIQRAATPTTSSGIGYYRLHGSPRMYYSSYSSDALTALAARIDKAAARGTDIWCIFDNTAAGAALDNAIELQTLVRRK